MEEAIDINRMKITVPVTLFFDSLYFLEDMAGKLGIDYEAAFDGKGLELDSAKVIPNLIKLLKDDYDRETKDFKDIGKRFLGLVCEATGVEYEDLKKVDMWTVGEVFLRIFLHFKGGNIDENFILKKVMTLVGTTAESSTTATGTTTPKKKTRLKSKSSTKV